MSQPTKHILVASDFDKTLSFNDSGKVLSEMLGAADFAKRVEGLSRINIVQQGAELAYLLRHDPDYRCVRRDLLWDVGPKVELKRNVKEFVDFLTDGVEGCRFDFRVISAGPSEVVRSALDGIVAPEHVYGTDFDFDEGGEISAIRRAGRRLRKGGHSSGTGGRTGSSPGPCRLHRRRELGPSR